MLKISKTRSNLKYAVLALLSINFHGYGNFADHREVELFKLDRDALIAAKRQRFTVVAALAVLQDELNARTIDNTSFTRLALGMIVGNGDPIGVTTTLRYTPDEQNLVLGVIRNALSLLNMAGQVFNISQLWSKNSDAGQAHVNVLNQLARSTPKKDGAPVNFVTQVAQAYLTIEHRAARLRVGETSGLIEMALRYQSNPVYKKFLFVFIDLAPEAQQLVAQKFSSIPAGVLAAKDKQEIFVNLTRNPTTYIEDLWVEKLEEVETKYEADPKTRGFFGGTYARTASSFSKEKVKKFLLIFDSLTNDERLCLVSAKEDGKTLDEIRDECQDAARARDFLVRLREERAVKIENILHNLGENSPLKKLVDRVKLSYKATHRANYENFVLNLDKLSPAQKDILGSASFDLINIVLNNQKINELKAFADSLIAEAVRDAERKRQAAEAARQEAERKRQAEAARQEAERKRREAEAARGAASSGASSSRSDGAGTAESDEIERANLLGGVFVHNVDLTYPWQKIAAVINIFRDKIKTDDFETFKSSVKKNYWRIAKKTHSDKSSNQGDAFNNLNFMNSWVQDTLTESHFNSWKNRGW